MSRAKVLGFGFALAAVAAGGWWAGRLACDKADLFEPVSHTIEPSPPCPWREADTDMVRLFPEANRLATETRILSGLRIELARSLGRPLNPGEYALTLARVFNGARPLGRVLARRVKGEHGAIELVLAVTERGEVQDVRLQRLREPAAVARAVQDPGWLGKFQGRTHDRGWGIDDARDLPAEARVSAQAIREGIRSLLVLLAASEGLSSSSTPSPYH